MNAQLFDVVSAPAATAKKSAAEAPPAGHGAEGAAASQPFGTVLQQRMGAQEGAPEKPGPATERPPAAEAGLSAPERASAPDAGSGDGVADTNTDADTDTDTRTDELTPEEVEALIQQLLAGNPAAAPASPEAAADQIGIAAPAAIEAAAGAGAPAEAGSQPAAAGAGASAEAGGQPAASAPSPGAVQPATGSAKPGSVSPSELGMMPETAPEAPPAGAPPTEGTGTGHQAGVAAGDGRRPPADLQSKLAEASAQVVSSGVPEEKGPAQGPSSPGPVADQPAQGSDPLPAAKAGANARGLSAAAMEPAGDRAPAPAVTAGHADAGTPAPAPATAPATEGSILPAKGSEGAPAGPSSAGGPEAPQQLAAGLAPGHAAAGPEPARHQAPAPPPQDSSLVLNRQEVMEQVVRSARLGLERGQPRFEMRLEPPSLGRVGVVMDLKDGQLNITLRAESAAVREALQNSLPQLRESLSAQGLNLGGCDVQGFGRGDRSQGEATPQSGLGHPQSTSSGEDGEEAPAGRPAGTGRLDGGVLDYWA